MIGEGCILGRLRITMVVYHYTSIDALEKILFTHSEETKSFRLRATHCNFLNDGTESILGARLLPKYVNEIEKELHIPEQWQLEPAFNDEQYLQNLIRHIKTFNDTKDTISKFVASFSKAYDNLVMWSMYGNKGNGVALGFDSEYLTDCLKNRVPDFPYQVEECIYLRDDELSEPYDKESAIYKYSKDLYIGMCNPQVRMSLYELLTDETANDRVRWNNVMNTLVINLITHVSMFCKLDMWKNEQEYRLVLDDITRNIRYRKNSNNVYVPYVDFLIPQQSLKEIVIGPTCGQNAHGMINSLFYQRGLNPNDIAIKHSSCPLQ